MEKKPYHHGELKKALIENGIEFINQYGEEKLSLRKVAEKCGVSNAAPYAHFKDKDDFINRIVSSIVLLPKKNSVLVGGGGGDEAFSLIKHSLDKIGISAKKVDFNVGMQGLMVIANQYFDKTVK